MKKNIPAGFIIFPIIIFFIAISVSNSSCKIYSFNDVSIPDSIKTIKINQLANKASYVNPQLAPQLTDKLRQKITGQTRLTQVNNDDADYEVSGQITQYSVSTSGISSQKVATNRLNVSVSITLNKRKDHKVDPPFTISRNFEFDANLSLTAAESSLNDEMIRNLTDEIFNKIFSNW